jgi:hypothetical protein
VVLRLGMVEGDGCLERVELKLRLVEGNGYLDAMVLHVDGIGAHIDRIRVHVDRWEGFPVLERREGALFVYHEVCRDVRTH